MGNCKHEWVMWEGPMEAYGVKVLAHGDQCASCNEITFTPAQSEEIDRRLAARIALIGVADGKALRFMRKQAGFKAKEFAKLIGVTPETVSRWENGTVSAPIHARFIVVELFERSETADKLRRIAELAA